MSNPIIPKLTLKKSLPTMDLSKVKNVKINGVVVGCSGFIPTEKGLVYVNTDCGIMGNTCGVLYRTAKHDKDYTGGSNQYCKDLNLLQSEIKNTYRYN